MVWDGLNWLFPGRAEGMEWTWRLLLQSWPCLGSRASKAGWKGLEGDHSAGERHNWPGVWVQGWSFRLACVIWEQECTEGGLWACAAYLPEWELFCPCVKEEEAESSVSAPPLLKAPGNDPEQGTKGTVQGWDSFCCLSACVQAWHRLPESTRRATVRESCSCKPRGCCGLWSWRCCCTLLAES